MAVVDSDADGLGDRYRTGRTRSLRFAGQKFRTLLRQTIVFLVQPAPFMNPRGSGKHPHMHHWAHTTSHINEKLIRGIETWDRGRC